MRGNRFSFRMAVYLYETTDPEAPAESFELRQSMLDEPLTEHPVTGVPIRRVITGGLGFMTRGGAPAPLATRGAHCCGGHCGCH